MTAPGRPTRAFVIVNPVHRRARAARRELARQAAGAGIVLVELQTSRTDPGPGQARRALAAGAEHVIVCGGDGTVRLVAGVLAGTGVRLGLVPTGTANLFARNVGIDPGRLRATVASALAGAPRHFDLGWARLRGASGWSDEQPFLVLAGLGHDAATVLHTSERLKRRVRWLAYFVSGVRHLFRAPLRIELTLDGGVPRAARVWSVLVANCGRLPGGVRAFSQARPDDGVLDTLVVRLRHPAEWVLVAAKGLLRLRRDVAPLSYGRARTVNVRPTNPVPCQLDGDAVALVGELSVRVDPGALLVNVSAKGRR